MGQSRANRIPLIIGGAVLAVGLGVGLWPRGGPPAVPSAAPSASLAPSASATPPDTIETEDYEPDLSGPDIGELIVDGASMAHDLDIVGGRLVWLLTDGATLGSARIDGGATVVVFSTDDENAFGGAMASTSDFVWWSVESEGDDPEPIYRAAAADLSAPLANPIPIAKGTSPDYLAAGPPSDLVVWADLGRVTRFDAGSARTLAQRDGRIVSVATAADAVFFLEAPMQGGTSNLSRVSPEGGQAAVLAGKLEARERDSLVVVNGVALWAESDGKRHTLQRLGDGASATELVTATGIVTAIVHDDQQIVWAEAHGSEETPTTLLRAIPASGKQVPKRIGRVQGHVTALAMNASHLFWSSPRGIERHSR